MNYVFDVDGTLTPSRGLIDPYFAEYFLEFCQRNPVYLCSGSDYAKTWEQVGLDICLAAKAVYSCAGNAKYVQGELIYANDFELTLEERRFLDQLLEDSLFPLRTGNHLEHRLGLYNFSVVGRNADRDERRLYFDYDSVQGERPIMAAKIREQFPRLEAAVAGETGIDIFLAGCNKSQIAKDLGEFRFFGDSIYLGGNDYEIAMAAQSWIRVKDWRETWEFLKVVDKSS